MNTKIGWFVAAGAFVAGCVSLDNATVANGTNASTQVARSRDGRTAVAASTTAATTVAAAASRDGRSSRDSSTAASSRTDVRPQAQSAAQEEKVYEVEDFKQAFAKMTPEKIADAFIKADKGETKHSIYKMADAIDWQKGFTVAKLLKGKVHGDTMWEKFYDALYSSLSNLPDQKTVKAAVDQLPEKSEWLDCGYDKGTRYYEKVINQITDPEVADYMLSKNLYLKFKIALLVKKLSAAKKAELVASAKDRAAKCKDKIVMEGFYLGMPYLDAEILADNLGLNIPSEKGSTRNLINFGTDDFEDYKNLKMSDCKINHLTLLPKGWVKFIDIDDDTMLPYQFIHQYVAKKPGKAGKVEYLGKIKLETNANGYGFWIYSSAKLGTKVSFSKSWWIEFIEM